MTTNSHDFTNEAPPLKEIPEHLRYSPSKLKLYHFCEQRAHHHYIDGLRVEGLTTEALLRGKVMHKYLELWHGPEHVHPNDAFPVLYKSAEFGTHEGQLLVMWGNTCMVRYIGKYKKEDHQRYIFHSVEDRSQVPITTPKGRTVYLDGILDTLVEDKYLKTIGPWDHKTSGRNLWTKDAVVFNPQLGQYVCMSVALGWPIKTATVNQIYTGIKDIKNLANTPLDKLFSRHTIDLTPTQIEQWTWWLGARIDKIIDAQEAPEPAFEMNLGEHCPKGCPFNSACRMRMNKQDPTPYIQNVLTPAIKRMANPDDIDVEITDEVTEMFAQ